MRNPIHLVWSVLTLAAGLSLWSAQAADSAVANPPRTRANTSATTDRATTADTIRHRREAGSEPGHARAARDVARHRPGHGSGHYQGAVFIQERQ